MKKSMTLLLAAMLAVSMSSFAFAQGKPAAKAPKGKTEEKKAPTRKDMKLEVDDVNVAGTHTIEGIETESDIVEYKDGEGSIKGGKNSPAPVKIGKKGPTNVKRAKAGENTPTLVKTGEKDRANIKRSKTPENALSTKDKATETPVKKKIPHIKD